MSEVQNAKTEEENKVGQELSKKIIKIKREKNKDGKHQYSVLFEGDESKKGVWVDASEVTDPAVIADFEKRLAKREKKKEKAEKSKEEKHKHSKDSKNQENTKKEESKPKKQSSSSKQKQAIEKIHGLIQSQPELIFSVKLKDKGYVEMTSKEMKEKYPKEFCDFLIKHLQITEPVEN